MAISGAVSGKPAFEAAKRIDTLSHQTYMQLRRALMTGNLSPGERLTVRGVADTFGVSLSPAREALGRLVAERALILEQNRSISVPALTQQEYRDLVGIRLLLEGHAAEKAAENATPEFIEKLEETHARMAKLIREQPGKKALQVNEDFHFLIYRQSNIPALVSIIETLWLQIGPMFNLLTPEYQRSARGLANHAAAIEAAKKADGKALRQAIEKDLHDGSKAMEKLLPA